MVDKTKQTKATKLVTQKDKMRQSLAKPEVSDLIGERLRSFYDAVSQQPVPDRFLDLLKQLEAAPPPKEKA
jgi:hypothetical protein